MRQTVYDYIRETYQVSPEYPWRKQDGEGNELYKIPNPAAAEPDSENRF